MSGILAWTASVQGESTTLPNLPTLGQFTESQAGKGRDIIAVQLSVHGPTLVTVQETHPTTCGAIRALDTLNKMFCESFDAACEEYGMARGAIAYSPGHGLDPIQLLEREDRQRKPVKRCARCRDVVQRDGYLLANRWYHTDCDHLADDEV